MQSGRCAVALLDVGQSCAGCGMSPCLMQNSISRSLPVTCSLYSCWPCLNSHMPCLVGLDASIHLCSRPSWHIYAHRRCPPSPCQPRRRYVDRSLDRLLGEVGDVLMACSPWRRLPGAETCPLTAPVGPCRLVLLADGLPPLVGQSSPGLRTSDLDHLKLYRLADSPHTLHYTGRPRNRTRRYCPGVLGRGSR